MHQSLGTGQACCASCAEVRMRSSVCTWNEPYWRMQKGCAVLLVMDCSQNTCSGHCTTALLRIRLSAYTRWLACCAASYEILFCHTDSSHGCGSTAAKPCRTMATCYAAATHQLPGSTMCYM